ncbi:hypothetical protein BGZ94_008662 [Podila epigama]|nr:hypothetical protein BGZ94_008662 [Podila epigama]
MLCLCPALWGIYIHLKQARDVKHRDARDIMTLTSSALDNYVGILWCLLGGLWSFWLTNNLIRRWFNHYEPRPAMIRLFTLGTMFWFFVVSFVSYFGADQPIWPWMAICAILAVAQIIQTTYFRFRGTSYMGDHQKAPRLDSIAIILRTVVIPGGIVSFLTMVMLLHQNSSRPSSAETLAITGATSIATLNSAKQIIGPAQIQILILIISAWTPKGYNKRQVFRDTTLKLLPPNSPQFAFTYRFILGEAPNRRIKDSMGPKINEEQKEHGDLLILRVSDTYEDLSYKVFKALEWGNKYKFDFLCKTDDDIFVRWDVVARELMELGPTHYYWRGLAYWNIRPITNWGSKNYDSQYHLGVFPPFVAGSLYIFSRDIVSLLTYPGPRLFTRNEDQNIGIWLHPYNIRPIHDKRIQQWDVCEDDMIAKHFSESFQPAESMVDMYKNVIEHRRLCDGFRQDLCAACYSCHGRKNHWRDGGHTCDGVKGLTTVIKKNMMYETSPTVEVRDPMPRIGVKDEWIIPGVVSDASSIYSDTEDWARLHWAIWTTDPATSWQARHYQAIETLFVHNPNAILIILSNHIPADFFADYTQQGYQIHIMPFSKELLLERKWFFSQETEDWLRRWEDWKKAGKWFHVHLADYLRLVALYKYGGLYMDMDALWIRPPGDGTSEFIGADISDNPDDKSWTLDNKNTYLANGVMRFQRGRSMFRHIADSVFTVSNYDPECFSCGGPRAFTKYVKAHMEFLVANGLHILPSRGLYPYNWNEVQRVLKASAQAKQELLRVEERGIGLHLYGKVTSKMAIEEGSLVGTALSIWGLDLFRSKDSNTGPILQGPKTLYYLATATTLTMAQKDPLLDKVPGAFQGIDAVLIRGAEPVTRPSSSSSATPFVVTKNASLVVSVQLGSVTMDTSGAGSRKVDMDLGETVSMAQLNLALSRIRYIPPKTTAWNGSDKITIQVVFGSLQEELVIPVVRRVPPA